ncbi:hypothetical protein ACDY96_33640 [Rhizobium mongolense]
MAKLVFAMMQSLGVLRLALALLRHFIEEVRGLTGCVYGCRMSARPG